MSTSPERSKPNKAADKEEQRIMKYAEARGWGPLFEALRDLEQRKFLTEEAYLEAVESAVINFLESLKRTKVR